MIEGVGVVRELARLCADLDGCFEWRASVWDGKPIPMVRPDTAADIKCTAAGLGELASKWSRRHEGRNRHPMVNVRVEIERVVDCFLCADLNGHVGAEAFLGDWMIRQARSDLRHLYRRLTTPEQELFDERIAEEICPYCGSRGVSWYHDNDRGISDRTCKNKLCGAQWSDR